MFVPLLTDLLHCSREQTGYGGVRRLEGRLIVQTAALIALMTALLTASLTALLTDLLKPSNQI